MIRVFLASLIVVVFSSCSSVGVYDLQKQRGVTVTRPTKILVEPFVAPASVFELGPRSPEAFQTLRAQIVSNLADQTSRQIKIYAANSAVIPRSSQPSIGAWLVRGEIRKVHQGSRALRAAVGMGVGRTEMRTRVVVFQSTSGGLLPLITFNTTGNSGLEPGAALGLATGGTTSALAAAGTASALALNSLPGVSTDIDRTSYEIAAVLSSYLQSQGLLDSSRRAISPNMKGRLPTTVNASRIIPAPLRN